MTAFQAEDRGSIPLARSKVTDTPLRVRAFCFLTYLFFLGTIINPPAGSLYLCLAALQFVAI